MKKRKHLAFSFFTLTFMVIVGFMSVQYSPNWIVMAFIWIGVFYKILL